jgi:hypothetical protein
MDINVVSMRVNPDAMSNLQVYTSTKKRNATLRAGPCRIGGRTWRYVGAACCIEGS